MPVKVGLRTIEIWKSNLEKEVQNYEAEGTAPGQIVFYGPSYFTRWSEKYGMTPLREAVRGKSGAACCVNRGFGSSCAEHQLYYYHRMVRAIEPKVLVYQSYGNFESFGYSADENWELAQRVIAYAMTDFPDIQIYLPCPGQRRDERNFSQQGVIDRYANMVRRFAEDHPENCHYLDLTAFESLNRKDIYVDDGVHFNQEGYKLYGEYFNEALKDELAKF